MGTCRWTYNQCVQFQKNNKVNLKILREFCVNKDTDLLKKENWVLKTPQSLRDNTLRKFIIGLKTNLKQNKQFQMKFRNRRDISFRTLEINKREFKTTLFPRFSNGIKIKTFENIPETEGSVIIKADRLWNFYIHIPIKWETEIKEILDPKIISLDPGDRTFLTGFDTNRFYNFHDSGWKKIDSKLKNLDYLLSKKSKISNKKKCKNKKKAIKRYITKIKRIRKEIHYKTASYLTKNFDIIILPTFKTENVAKNLCSKVCRSLYTKSHFSFRQYLKFKCEEKGKMLIDISEAFTSKTCSSCGTIKEDLKSSKVFNCLKCKMSLGRDFNASKNILMRYFCRLGP